MGPNGNRHAEFLSLVPLQTLLQSKAVIAERCGGTSQTGGERASRGRPREGPDCARLASFYCDRETSSPPGAEVSLRAFGLDPAMRDFFPARAIFYLQSFWV